MTPEDRTLADNWAHRGESMTLTLATASGAVGERMAEFCHDIEAIAPALKVKKTSDETGFSAPAMIIGAHKNVAFQAVPSGKLLERFLSALAPGSDGATNLDDALATIMEKIDLPIPLKLYVAPQCPHCPGMLDRLLPLASSNPHLRLTIIDAQQFDEAALNDQVRSVPTLIMDSQFRWSGPCDLHEVLNMALQRDPAQLSAASLRQLIEDGQAQRVSQMMVEADTLFPALIALLTHERWSVRLGAMVTAEYLADDAKPLALDLAARLWDQFDNFSDPVKGDVVHVMGQVHSDTTRGYLDSVLSGDFDETVKEAAAEAIKEMEESLT